MYYEIKAMSLNCWFSLRSNIFAHILFKIPYVINMKPTEYKEPCASCSGEAVKGF